MSESAQQVSIEPPYGIILNELREGRAIPFLGSGASRMGMEEGAPLILPSGSQLANMLAADASFPSSDPHDRSDLAKVSSYYEVVSNRTALRSKLRRVFAVADCRCNDLHRFLAAVANNLVIVTTNYDTLLEQAFLEIEKPYDLMVHSADIKDCANSILWWPHGSGEPTILRSNSIDIEDFRGRNLIYKIHGSVNARTAKWDSFVITEEDYIKFLSLTNAVPPTFEEYFKERAFLFLGYSLRDWNMRVLLKNISDGRNLTSWAIMSQPSTFERKLWERRMVEIFDVQLDVFVASIQARTRV